MPRTIATLLLAAPLLAPGPGLGQADPGRPAICSDQNLKRAVQIVHEGCMQSECDFQKLKKMEVTVDKTAFVAVFRDPYLRSLRIFFPINKFEIGEAFDWKSTKKQQVDAFQFYTPGRNDLIFVIGSASDIGATAHNRDLSARRMESVLDYLKNELSIQCNGCFHQGFLGEEVMQLSLDDAQLLNVDRTSYRNDKHILNQSVHVFVYPCPLG